MANTSLKKVDQESLVLPPDVELLEDNGQYTNRFDFVAASGNVYRVAQSKKGRWWSCSCPSWIYNKEGNRHCKHLRDFGLPPDYQPFEIGHLELGAPGTVSAIGASPMARSKGKHLHAAPTPAALPAAAPELPLCRPKKVEMQDGEIVVTFDAKDQAAVFQLLGVLCGKPS